MTISHNNQAALRLAIVGGKVFWADSLDGQIYIKNGKRMFRLHPYETGGDDCCAPEGRFDVEEITDET